jgi:hypothetical protein
VPIDRCDSSRFQRAGETARLIAGKDPEATADVSEGGQVVSPDENNRLMEGEVSIFRPDGTGRYALIGRVQIDRWSAAR